MSRYEKGYISRQAEELNFIRDTLEKTYRITDILEYLNANPLLRESVALKGGTAINLVIFNLPRLSVDIDLDFMKPVRRDEMLVQRDRINNDIFRYMETAGYTLIPKSKTPHSLDSWVFDYINSGGNRDNVKIEINYSMRHHIFPAMDMPVLVKRFLDEVMVLTQGEREFLRAFEGGTYRPDLLFEDLQIVDRIRDHPMALWKTRSS